MNEEFTPQSHVPYGSEGSGYYSDSVLGCHNVVKATQDMVQHALEMIPYSPTDGAFTICDYGTADGGTSMVMLTGVIKWLKDRYGDTVNVHVVYEDQPINDFKSLFLRVHGLIPGPPSYYKDNKNVYVTASGTNFYSQCVPDNFVHLGFSSTAFNRLSKCPGTLDDAIVHVCSKNTDQVAAYSQQAATDWQTILLHRARELRPGGQMVIACMCIDNEGSYAGKSPYITRSLYHELNSCWWEMLGEGKITQDECNGVEFNSYLRTVEEFKTPFTEGTTVHKAGLRLIAIETKTLRCPFHVKWMAEDKKDDQEMRRKHAQWYIPAVRVWSNNIFLSALDTSRPEGERTTLVDTFYQKYEDRVASAPDEHGIDYVHAYIHFEKI